MGRKPNQLDGSKFFAKSARSNEATVMGRSLANATQQAAQDDTPQQPEETTAEAYQPSPGDIDSWFDGLGWDEQQTKFILYRFGEGNSRGPQGRIVCDEYIGERPTIKEIGTSYGAGKYELVAIGPKQDKDRLVRVRKFELDEVWTARKAQHDRQYANQAAQQPVVSGVDPINQGLEMVARVMGILTPLLTQRAPDPIDSIKMMGEAMQQMMRSSIQDTMQIRKEIMLAMPTAQAQPDEIDETTENELGQVVNTLKQFLPLFLASPAPIQNQMAATSLKNPTVKKILNTEILRKRLEDSIDREFDPQQVSQIMGAFDKAIKRTKENPAGQQAPGSPAQQMDGP